MRAVVLFAAAIAGAACGPAMAQTAGKSTIATAQISAIVSGDGTCSVSSMQNPSVTSATEAMQYFNLTTDATFAVTCTDAATPYVVYAAMSNNANDTVQRRVKSTTAVIYLNYDIYTDSARTTRWPTTFATGLQGQATSTTYHMYPRVPAQYGATAGTYIDTISFVVTY